MRAFLAYSIPNNVQEEISELCYGLPNTTWVKPFNFHLTIQFYSNLSEEQVPNIQENLEKLPLSIISTKAKGLGKFSHPRRESVIWLGIENSDQVVKERNKIIPSLKELKLEVDKKFSPHITLGRCKQLNERRWLSYLETFEFFESSEFLLDSIVLYKSILNPKGSIYEEIFRVYFNKS